MNEPRSSFAQNLRSEQRLSFAQDLKTEQRLLFAIEIIMSTNACMQGFNQSSKTLHVRRLLSMAKAFHRKEMGLDKKKDNSMSDNQ